MHFDVVVSVFIHSFMHKKAEETVDTAVCVRARASDVFAENFSHSAWVLLQHS